MTPQETRFEFEALPTADLVVDAIYAGGSAQTFAADPLGRLLPVGNQGGFRYKVGGADRTVLVVALYTSGRESDWPDSLDEQAGLFTYYGDNRHPGRELHATARGGNRILRDAFERSHADADARASVSPFLLFASTGSGRDIRFRGLLAPGAATLGADEDLQAIWRSTGGQRFQNYRAQFTVLDEPVVTRAWLRQVLAGDPLGPSCPIAWRSWTNGRAYRSLIAPPTTIIRGRATQTPDRLGQAILATIHDWFADDPHGFEACAVELWRMIAPATGTVDLTRPNLTEMAEGMRSVSTWSARQPIASACTLPWRPSATGRAMQLACAR